MRIGIRTVFSLLSVMSALLASRPMASAQPTATAAKQSRAELAIDYNFVRSNAPPGGCTCFNMNGGSATFAWPVRPGHFALVGDISVAHTGSISSKDYSLTLSTFTAGARYVPRVGHLPVRPYVQALAGIAHASGSLVEGFTPATANAGAAFAANIGGGLDVRTGHAVSFRLIEASYLLTRIDNGRNDHQNNLRLGAGVVFHF